MPLFTVMRRGEPPVTIDADNWIVAMGAGIARLGGEVAIDRLACEMLSNGTVIARDVRSGAGYVILPAKGGAVLPRDPTEEEPAMESPPDDTVDDLLDGFEDSSLDETMDFALTEDEMEQLLTRIRDSRSAMDAWDVALTGAAEAVEVEGATAVEATPNAGLIFASVHGPLAHKLRAMTLPYGTGFVGFCIERCTTLMVHDVKRDERHYAAVDDVTGFATRSVLCVPIADEKQVFGCIELLNPVARFSRADLELLENIGAALSDRLARAGVRGRRRD